MKSLEEINSLLTKFKGQYGIDALNAQQGSAEWFQVKLGVPSASNAHKIVAKVGTATRETYMSELVAQVATGIMPELNGLSALEWGKDNEDGARSSYEFATGDTAIEVPFVFKDDTFRVGMSPDFLIEGKPKSAEIKCPFNSANYVQFLCMDKIKSEWDWQCNYQMWTLESDELDFCQFDPRMKKNPIKIMTVEKDLKKQKTLDDAVPQFIADLDKMLAKAGFVWGEQWERIKKEKGVAA